MSNDPGKARGILKHSPGPGVFHHARVPPSPALSWFVQHFWIVRWDLRGHPPQVRETLPHPNVHLVLEPGRSRINGAHSRRFTRMLEEQGGVLGVKFRPGGFHPFFQRPVSGLRDRSLLPRTVFGATVDSLEAAVFAQQTDEQSIALVEAFLHEHMPAEDPVVVQVGEIVDGIVHDRAVTSVEQLVQRWGLEKRRLQRLFSEYVGVSPKWVINRYRLHEAVERLAEGGTVDWVQLALELGYFDQAHFIRDFKKLVGRPPGEYAR
ncbi:MAG TPA: helix-turn-helix domain-containing protein [Lysobacter sp.]|nr:helix-turn-helix domain-containing protein [Lysobacter sp.]